MESFAPFQGAGFIGDGGPGWASYLVRPGAIGCNASGVPGRELPKAGLPVASLLSPVFSAVFVPRRGNR